MNKTAANERTKLLATALNTAGTSCVTVGVLAPVAAAFLGVGGAAAPWKVAVCCVCYLSAAVALHLLARRVLGRIME